MKLNKDKLIESIKLTLAEAKNQPEFYDQKLVSEIEGFIGDTTEPSFDLIFEKAVKLSIDALVKKGMIDEIKQNGETVFYKAITKAEGEEKKPREYVVKVVRCPVCDGCGTVPYGFYPDQPRDATGAGHTQCRGCMGRGIVEGVRHD